MRALTAAPCLAAPVPHLRVDAALDADAHDLSGQLCVRWPNTEAAPLEALHFALPLNQGAEPNPHLSSAANAAGHFLTFEPSGTTITRAWTPDGAPLEMHFEDAPSDLQTYSLARGYAAVRLPAPLPPGETAEVCLAFRSHLPHRAGDDAWMSGVHLSRFGWLPLPRGRQDQRWETATWLAPFTHETRIEVPPGFTGTIGGDAGGAEGGAVTGRSERPVRSVPVLLYDGVYEALRGQIGDVAVEVHYRPDGALLFDQSPDEARRVLDWLRRILPFYEKMLGPLPHKRLAVAELPGPVAMAADGLILLSDVAFIHDTTWWSADLVAPLSESVLAHEVAHFYFGLGVGADFDCDNFLSESLSQYVQLEYMEAAHGAAGEPTYLDPNWFIFWLHSNSAGTGLPEDQRAEVIEAAYDTYEAFGVNDAVAACLRSRRNPEETAYSLYYKGYLMVRALRTFMPAETLHAALREIATTYRGSRLDAREFQRALERHAGQPLDVLFDGWLRGDAHANYRVDAVTSRGGETEIALSRSGGPPLPVQGVAERPDGTTEELRWLGPDAAHVWRVPGEVSRVHLDPERVAPDTDRRDNLYPRETRWAWHDPRRDPERYTLTVSALPLHRHYLAGVSLGGNDVALHQWWTGAGIRSFSLGAAPRSETNPELRAPVLRLESAVYAEGIVATGRGRAVGVTTIAAHRRQENAPDMLIVDARLASVHAVFDRVEVGWPARANVPRWTFGPFAELSRDEILSAAAYIDPVNLDDPDDDVQIADAFGLFVGFAAQRDDALTLGLVHTGEVAYGGRDNGRGLVLRGALTSQYTIPTAGGRLTLAANGGAVTASGRDLDRPDLVLLPVRQYRESGAPYDLVAQAQLGWGLPLMRTRRLRNALTLWSLVIGDLDLQAHYGVARGWLHGGGGLVDPLDPALGEAGLRYRVELLPFFDTAVGVGFGVGLPVWPAETDLSGIGFFLTADAGTGG